MASTSSLAQIIGSRDSQQDRIARKRLADGRILFVLADGMGGHRGGETAAETALAAFAAYFAQHPQAADVPQTALKQALDAANRRLAAVLAAQPELHGMGTTLLAVLLDEAGGRFDYVSVGDSPLYCWASGSLRRINANHAFAEILKTLVEQGEMSEDEARRHPSRHAITSAVGGGDIPMTDAGGGAWTAGSRLLLASDGIHTLNDKEIAAILTQGGTADGVADALLAAVAAKNRAGQDNTSVIVLAAGRAAAPQTQVFRQPAAPQTLVQSEKHQAHHAPRRRTVWPVAVAALAAVLALSWCAAGGGKTETVRVELPLPSKPPVKPSPETAASAASAPQPQSGQ